MSLPDVTYFRPYYGPGSKKGQSEGTDVLAFKWVLIRAGYLKQIGQMPDGIYNQRTVNAVKELQRDAQITPVTGYTGKATFEALRLTHKKGSKTEWAWDEFRANMYNEAIDQLRVPTEDEVRAYIAQQLYIMYVNRDAIGYGQGRPVWAIIRKIVDAAKARIIDCSGTAMYGGALADWHFRSSGIMVPAYDPMFGNSGYGNTFSLVMGGRRIVRSEARVGDLVFYTGHVATIVRVMGDSISVVSMGSNSGPLYLPDNYRSDIMQYRTYNLREVPA